MDAVDCLQKKSNIKFAEFLVNYWKNNILFYRNTKNNAMKFPLKTLLSKCQFCIMDLGWKSLHYKHYSVIELTGNAWTYFGWVILFHADAYLKHPAHPLEAVLFAGIWPLLRHNHNPLIVEHCDWKHSDPDKHRNTHKYRKKYVKI